MTVGAADLTEAIVTAWDASTLDASFQALWDSGITVSEFSVLRDVEAPPGQPFPYCVFEQGPSVTTDRMSGSSTVKREIRDVPFSFKTYAREISNDVRTAKKIAADMIGDILKVFGGHPTLPHVELTLDNGHHLITQYQSDFGVRADEDVYSWILNYIFRLDIPVTV